MQDVDNDMDDLFRKAAEQYPLKTEGADWQKVLAGLQDVSARPAEERENRRRRALWLFLLLPLGLLWSVYYKSDNQPVQKETIVKGNTTSKESRSSLQKPDFALNEKSSSEEENKDNTTSSVSSDEKKNKLRNSATNDDGTLFAHNHKESLRKGNKPDLSATGFVRFRNKENSGYKQAVPNNYTVIGDSNKNIFSALQPDALSKRIDKENAKELNTAEAIDSSVQSRADSMVVTATKKDSTANDVSNNNKNKQIKVKPHMQSGFYAGLLASFDVSTVKLQRINKTGDGLQALAGYRFSNRLSIESGLSWSLKNYYSKGKYFDKKKANIPDAVNIYFTNGNCKMLEVPLNVKYDFVLHKKSNLFATVGLSSYFMKKESYSYTGDYMTWVYDTTLHYKNSGSNLFSVASLSMGYQLQLNNNLSLRAEPYIKVPLHGIGTANLPIASVGISVGLTRKF